MHHIMRERNEKNGRKTLNQIEKANVLVETSGDTGPAAVASIMLLNTEYVNIFALFPRKQVSPIQARQLTTAKAKYGKNMNDTSNVTIYATDKSSDHQCLIVKRIFNDTSFVEKYNICAMNSINFCRILAQITYYFWAYIQLFKKELSTQNENVSGNSNSKENSVKYNKHLLPKINVSIPSGAFGNTIACCLAKCMGLPLGYIIPSTNENDIVYRTLMNGDFSSDAKDYHWTMSPAMDVQVPYNIERFFYLSFNHNTLLVNSIMKEFEKNGHNASNLKFSYQFDAILQSYFSKYIEIAYKTDDNDICKTIRNVFNKYNYLLGPHSCCSVYAGLDFVNKYKNINNGTKNNYDTPMVCIATAHTAKFPEIIDNAMKDKNGQLVGGEKKDEEYLKWFKHPFLPNENDKEEFKLLPNGDDWDKQWIKIIKNDIIALNHQQTMSKL